LYETYEAIVKFLTASSIPFTIHEHAPSLTVAEAEAYLDFPLERLTSSSIRSIFEAPGTEFGGWSLYATESSRARLRHRRYYYKWLTILFLKLLTKNPILNR
jgi:hypothetical protein